MSEPKKWVGYADLLEAKRQREEREEQTAPDHSEETSTEDTQQHIASVHTVEKQADTETTPVASPATPPVSAPVATPVITSAPTPATIAAPRPTPVSTNEPASL